jgi:hypothetical protein
MNPSSLPRGAAQTLADGKPLIVEGLHLDPGAFISQLSRRGVLMLPARPSSPTSSLDGARVRRVDSSCLMAASGGGGSGSGGLRALSSGQLDEAIAAAAGAAPWRLAAHAEEEEPAAGAALGAAAPGVPAIGRSASLPAPGRPPPLGGGGHATLQVSADAIAPVADSGGGGDAQPPPQQPPPSPSAAAAGPVPLFVPIVLRMDPADHCLIAEEAQRCAQRAADVALSESQAEGLRAATGRTLELQRYLCGFEDAGLPVVRVAYGRFDDALDALHEYVLQCIKEASSGGGWGGSSGSAGGGGSAPKPP